MSHVCNASCPAVEDDESEGEGDEEEDDEQGGSRGEEAM